MVESYRIHCIIIYFAVISDYNEMINRFHSEQFIRKSGALLKKSATLPREFFAVVRMHPSSPAKMGPP